MNYAYENGVVFVAAGGVNSLGYPASYNSVVSVGAIDAEGVITDFSDFDSMANTIYAPGTSIFSGYHNGDYAWWTGNSMATPFVAGTAALMMSTGSCDANCVHANLQNTAHAVVVDPTTQELYGRIDAYDAVAKAASQSNNEFSAQLRDGFDNEPNDQIIKPFIQISNFGNSVLLHELTARYWYSSEGDSPEQAVCDFAAVGCDNVQLTIQSNAQGHYLELGFATDDDALYGGHNTADIQLRVHKTDWTTYDESDDYSASPYDTLLDWEGVTLYHNDDLVWGQEPTSPTDSPPPQPAPPEPVLPDTTDVLFATHHTYDTNPLNQEAKPIIGLVNNSASSLNLADLTIRYWTNDGETAVLQTYCDYASINCTNTTLTTTPNYIEVSFNQAAGNLLPGASLENIQLRFHHDDWVIYDETDDYSSNRSATTAIASATITIYQNGNLIWGIEP